MRILPSHRAPTWGTGPGGYCRRVLWIPGPRVQYSGKIIFIEKPGVQDEGSRHVAKCSSDPRVAYPEVNVQVRDIVRVVGIVAPFFQRGFSIREKFFLSSPSSGTSQESQVMFRNAKSSIRSLVLPRWRHETWSGALCKDIIHTLRRANLLGRYFNQMLFVQK